MLAGMFLLEDHQLMIDNEPTSYDDGRPNRLKPWRVKIQESMKGKVGEIYCTDVEIGLLMFIALGAGESGPDEPSHAAMVELAYKICEPLFEGMDKELRFIP